MADPSLFADLSEHIGTIVTILVGCLGIIGALARILYSAVIKRMDFMQTQQSTIMEHLLCDGTEGHQPVFKVCTAHSGLVAAQKNIEADRRERGRRIMAMEENLKKYIGEVEVRLTNRIDRLEIRQNGIQTKELEAV